MIKITWLTDSYDCDTCGTSWAEGAAVTINGLEAFVLMPIAHCYAGETYCESDVYKAILKHLGYEVEEVES